MSFSVESTSTVMAKGIIVGEGQLPLGDIVQVALGQAKVHISRSEEFSQRMHGSVAALERAMEQGIPVYGVTTGYGESCGSRIDPESSAQLGQNLIRYHGCGAGQALKAVEARAGTFCRLIGLARAYSGVSIELLQAMADFLNHDLAPVIPSQGSVGASGDLTPLSYLAACMQGQREVFYQGKRMPSSQALEIQGLRPYSFKPKEPLALINGTSVMTGIAIITLWQTKNLLRAAQWASALSVHAMAGHAHHFDEILFQAKPHPGQARVAQNMRELLHSTGPVEETDDPRALQDPYSLRCTPHVLGVLADSLEWIERWVQTEANSANDNPLLDPDSGRVVTGGNFYGGHIAFAMDGLKSALASVADLMDRQMALLVDERFNRGLPDDLVTALPAELHHGFKGLQITASALTSEALKETMPAASFSRSTESHNQDKVSLGTIAARDAAKVCDMVAGVTAIQLLASTQAAEIRGGLDSRQELLKIVNRVRKFSEPLNSDRPMDLDLEKLSIAVLDGKIFGSEDNV